MKSNKKLITQLQNFSQRIKQLHPLTVGQLIKQLQKFNPKSPVRLNVPIGPDDYSPKFAVNAYRNFGDVICSRDNGDPLDVYCGVLTHFDDVIIQGAPRNII